MMLKSLTLLLAATAMAGCTGIDDEIADLDNLDELESRNVDVADFTRINLETDAALVITMGDATSVTLYTESDHFDDLELEVEDGELTLKHLGSRMHNNHVALVVTVTSLDELNVAGATDARLRDLTLDDLTIDIAGAANVIASGSCNALEVDLAGASNIEARDMTCHSVEVSMSGAGNVEIFADESADISMSGVGNVDVYGNPRDVRESKSGFGSITVH